MFLLYLTSWKEGEYTYEDNGNFVKEKFYCSWKGYLYPAKNKNKSVTLTPERVKLAESKGKIF